MKPFASSRSLSVSLSRATAFSLFMIAVIFLAETASAAQPGWIFSRGRYTHDPETGTRVAQYERVRPVEPLPDQRLVTSGYRRSRTVVNAGGSSDTTIEVTNYGNDRGGLNAEWERFHDAWRTSTIRGGSFGWQTPSYPHQRYPAWPQHGWGGGQPGFPSYPPMGPYRGEDHSVPHSSFLPPGGG